MAMDSKVQKENKTLNGVVAGILIQHCPKLLCTSTVTTEASEQFC
jgi:hypothetical protein